MEKLIFGPIMIIIGAVFLFKRLELVKSSLGEDEDSPLLTKKKDGTQELVGGVVLVFNVIGGGFFIFGLVLILSVLF